MSSLAGFLVGGAGGVCGLIDGQQPAFIGLKEGGHGTMAGSGATPLSVGVLLAFVTQNINFQNLGAQMQEPMLVWLSGIVL